MGLSREDIFHAWHKRVHNSVLEISKIHYLLPDHVRVLVIGMFKERYPSFKDHHIDALEVVLRGGFIPIEYYYDTMSKDFVGVSPLSDILEELRSDY